MWFYKFESQIYANRNYLKDARNWFMDVDRNEYEI